MPPRSIIGKRKKLASIWASRTSRTATESVQRRSGPVGVACAKDEQSDDRRHRGCEYLNFSRRLATLPDMDAEIAQDELEGDVQEIEAEDELEGMGLEALDDGRAHLSADNRPAAQQSSGLLTGQRCPDHDGGHDEQEHQRDDLGPIPRNFFGDRGEMMRPTEELVTEHNAIKRMLDILERVSRRLEIGETVDAEHLERIVDFIRGFADRCHHGKEEDLLFPEMEEAGIP